jgi:hypothetical protein
MSLRGQGVIASFIEVSPSHESELGEWYNREHLDHRVNFERFKRARRYVSVDTPATFMAFYESDAVEDFRSKAYLTMLRGETEWSRRVVKLFTSFDRLACRVKIDAMTGIGGAMSLARFLPSLARVALLETWLRSKVFPVLTARPGVTGACALENDPQTANAPGNSYGVPLPETTECEWIVAVEGADSVHSQAALQELLDSPEFSTFVVRMTPVSRSYRLLYANHR